MARQNTDNPLAVTPARAADLLGVSRQFVMKLIHRGELYAKKAENRWLIPYDDLEVWLRAA